MGLLISRHTLIITATFLLLTPLCLYGGSESSAEEEFSTSKLVMDHIADSHEWHIYTRADGHHVSLYLPVILISRHSGFHLFSSRHISHGKNHRGFHIPEEGPRKGNIVEEGHYSDEGIPYRPVDLSITMNVAAMLVAAFIGLMLFISLGRSYARSGVSEPRGMQGFFEPIILFVKDEIAAPNIGEHKHERFMPFLLALFFFILINNLLGLIPFIPFGANVTGNISVTLVLALATFTVTQISGNSYYWRHILANPDVPFWLIPVMTVIEVVGMIAKPFALMIRLFANVTAGHIIVLSLVSLIFIFRSVWVSPASILFVLFMNCLELLVSFLQAYVFTLLSALFIGTAVEEPH